MTCSPDATPIPNGAKACHTKAASLCSLVNNVTVRKMKVSLSHLGYSSVTQDVIWTCGFLDPERFEVRQTGHPSDGLSYIPPLVRIDHLTRKQPLAFMLI